MIAFAKGKRFRLVDNEQWGVVGSTTADRKADRSSAYPHTIHGTTFRCLSVVCALHVNLKLFISQLLCKSDSLHTDIKRKDKTSGDGSVENFHLHDDWCTFTC
jgi:hypothetical protein